MVMVESVPDSSISFIWRFCMALFYLVSNPSVIFFIFRNFSMQPLIISCPGNFSEFAKGLNRIMIVFMFFFDCLIYIPIMDQAQPRLLSISSSFFRKEVSISAYAFSALKILTSARSFSNSVISSGDFRLPR